MAYNIIRLNRVTSTNDVARRFANRDETGILVVTAREQSAGRGRRDRSWLSSPGLGIYFSVVVYPDLPAPYHNLLSLWPAVAAAMAMRELTGAPVQVKWPNDLELDGAKLGGVLVETVCAGSRIRQAIIGMGLNLCHTREQFPPELRSRCTSLRIYTGSIPDPDAVLNIVLAQLERLAPAGKKPDSWSADTVRQWRGLCSHLGSRVEIEDDGERFTGTFIGLSPDGGARIRTDRGEEIETVRGHLTLRSQHAARH